MSVRTKILLFMAAVLSVYLGFLFAFVSFSNRQIDLTIDEANKEKSQTLNLALDASGISQRTIVDDYSLWDDTVHFLQGQIDGDWAKTNLEVALSAYSYDAIWLYDIDHHLVYAIDSQGGDSDIRSVRPSLQAFDELLTQRSIRYFIHDKNGIMEIYGRTIHKSNDDTRTAPHGFFITGDYLDEDRLNTMGEIFEGKVQVAGDTSTTTRALLGEDSSSLVVFEALHGVDGKEIAYLVGIVNSELATRLDASSSQFIFLSVAFGLAILAFLFVILYFFVNRPLQYLMRGLLYRQASVLDPISTERSEFGKLARAILELFDQKNKTEADRSRSDALLRSISDAVIGIDKNWKIVFINLAGEKLFGVSSREALGRSFKDLVHIYRARDRKEHTSFVEEALIHSVTTGVDEDVFIQDLAGNDIPIELACAPVLDSLGKSNGAVIISRDISRETQTRAIRSDFAHAAHQLRTPVSEAVWALSLAIRDGSDSSKNQNIEIATKAVEGIKKLVEQFLLLSQIEEKKLTIAKEPIVLRSLFDEIDKQIAKKAIDRGVKISYVSSSDDLVISTDHRFFSRVLLEVMENAILYGTSFESVSVKVEDLGQDILISIQNSGRPIPEKELAQIFTKFFRGSSAGEQVGGGLGLYLSREIMNLLGGKIWFASDYPEGTVFYVRHPK